MQAYPLHYACAAPGCPPVVILEMLQPAPQGFPDAAFALDRHGKLPLHHALEADQPQEVLSDLLQAFRCPLVMAIGIAKEIANGDFSQSAAVQYKAVMDARFEEAHERNAQRLEELQLSGAAPEDVAAAATVLRDMEVARAAAPSDLKPPACIRVARYVRVCPEACLEWLVPSFYEQRPTHEDAPAMLDNLTEHPDRLLPIHVAALCSAPEDVLRSLLEVNKALGDVLLPKTGEIPFEIAERMGAPASTIGILADFGPAWTVEYMAVRKAKQC